MTRVFFLGCLTQDDVGAAAVAAAARDVGGGRLELEAAWTAASLVLGERNSPVHSCARPRHVCPVALVPVTCLALRTCLTRPTGLVVGHEASTVPRAQRFPSTGGAWRVCDDQQGSWGVRTHVDKSSDLYMLALGYSTCRHGPRQTPGLPATSSAEASEQGTMIRPRECLGCHKTSRPASRYSPSLAGRPRRIVSGNERAGPGKGCMLVRRPSTFVLASPLH